MKRREKNKREQTTERFKHAHDFFMAQHIGDDMPDEWKSVLDALNIAADVGEESERADEIINSLLFNLRELGKRYKKDTWTDLTVRSLQANVIRLKRITRSIRKPRNHR